jgi:hypothetical protein
MARCTASNTFPVDLAAILPKSCQPAASQASGFSSAENSSRVNRRVVSDATNTALLGRRLPSPSAGLRSIERFAIWFLADIDAQMRLHILPIHRGIDGSAEELALRFKPRGSRVVSNSDSRRDGIAAERALFFHNAAEVHVPELFPFGIAPSG